MKKSSKARALPSKEEVNAKQDEYEASLDRLWALISSSTPAERKKLIKDLDEKVINDLRSRRNPYKRPIYAGSGTGVRCLAFSCINLTEKYQQRFAMTSLIGFIYRMLDEYEPLDEDEKKNYVSENDAKFSTPFNKKVKEIELQRPLDQLQHDISEVKEEMAKTPSTAALKKYFTLYAKLYKYHMFLLRQDKEPYLSKKKVYEEAMEAREQLARSKAKAKAKRGRTAIQKEGAPAAPQDGTAGEPQDGIAGEPKEDEASEAASNKPLTGPTAEEQELARTGFIEPLAKIDAEIAHYQELFNQLKKEYNEKVLNTKAKLKHNSLDDVEVERYELTEAELQGVLNQVKQELGITITAEEKTVEIQSIIQRFLDQYFCYNPDNHVKCSYKPNYSDPLREPIENQERDSYEYNIIPPDDTFFRWNRYQEHHYEELRQATDDIYCEKSDFEFAIVPLEYFTGTDQEDATRKFNSFKQKYAPEFDAEVMSATFNEWNLLGPWKQNRAVYDFYSENTEIIKRILDQNKEDALMGKRIVGANMKKKKKQNRKETGPDPPGLDEFLKANPSQVEKYGAKPAADLEVDDIIKPTMIPQHSEDASLKEVEVGVHVIKPRKMGKRTIGATSNWKFNIPSEEPKPGEVSLTSASEYKKKVAAGELEERGHL